MDAEPIQLVKDRATGQFVEDLRVCPQCERVCRGSRCPDCDTAEHVPLRALLPLIEPFKDGKAPQETGGSD